MVAHLLRGLALVLLVLWIPAGVLNYGLTLAWLQRGWPQHALQQCPADTARARKALLWGIGGLLGALAAMLEGDRPAPQGLLWRCLTPAEVRYLQREGTHL